MPYLIDGDNLLHAADEVGPWERPGRVRLCQLLSKWAEKRREQVRIIFDGSPPPAGVVAQMRQPRVEIRFSGSDRSADDAILADVAANSAPRRLTVVSSDRELRAPATRRRCRVIRSDEFARRVFNDLSRPARPPAEPPEKTIGPSREEAEQWLKTFREDGAGDSTSNRTRSQ